MYGFQIKSFNDSLNPTAQTRRSLERLAELLLRVVRLIQQQQQLWISQDHNKTGASGGGGEMGCDWLCHAKYFTLVQHKEGRGRWWQQLPPLLYLNIQTQLTFSTHWWPTLFKFISPTRN